MFEAHFPGVPQSVVSARRFAAGALNGVSAEVAEAVVLIASELASNSVRHAASAFEVRVEQLPDQIHIEVEDDGDGEPAIRTPGLTDTSGRGLQIVQALADEWGVVPKVQRSGKTVWVKIAVPPDDRERAHQGDDTDAAPERARRGRRTGSSGPTTTLSPVTGNGDQAGAPVGRRRWTGHERAVVLRGRGCAHRRARHHA